MEFLQESWEAIINSLGATWEIIIELVASFKLTDALDVLIVSFVIYNAIKLIRETRAGQLVKGLMIMLAAWLLASYLQLYMLKSFFNYFFQFSMLALLVVFQPEIRRALEQIGRSKLSAGINSGKSWLYSIGTKEEEELQAKRRHAINATADVCCAFQKTKTGALIVFERQTKLGDIIDTGTIVNAEPSVPLIGNIFFNKAPLHDGAMVIRDGMVYAAGCILPLTKNDSISVDLGTRHRAAIGMSENSDAVVVVVSEETGQISIAKNGELTRDYNRETLQSTLESLILQEGVEETSEKHQVKIPSIRRTKKR